MLLESSTIVLVFWRTVTESIHPFEYPSDTVAIDVNAINRSVVFYLCLRAYSSSWISRWVILIWSVLECPGYDHSVCPVSDSSSRVWGAYVRWSTLLSGRWQLDEEAEKCFDLLEAWYKAGRIQGSWVTLVQKQPRDVLHPLSGFGHRQILRGAHTSDRSCSLCNRQFHQKNSKDTECFSRRRWPRQDSRLQVLSIPRRVFIAVVYAFSQMILHQILHK